MADALGIDLGTTYSAAAVIRDGRAEIVTLGNRAAAVPSLVFLRSDESILVGEAAERRGIGEPQRLAREFKRRFGDTTPILLGPVPYSAERLSAQLLRTIVDTVTSLEGATPPLIAVAHPANWGDYKTDLMRQALSLADLGSAVLVSEPVAAAVHYAATERIGVGDVIAVYDLGGGTFDAAVLRRTEDGFEILGQPQGIERLGGIDFDDAIVQHVRRALGPHASELESDEAQAVALRGRLRQDATAAKEALSNDTDTVIQVPLSSGAVEVRLTRSEFEAMIRPPLRETIGALTRAIESAGVSIAELRAVLLVGGSSRIPLVAEMVGAELGYPIAVDAHPKHAIALGAALFALQGKKAPPGTSETVPLVSESRGKQSEIAPVPAPVPTPAREESPCRASRSRNVKLAGVAVAALVAAAAVAWSLSGGSDPGAEQAKQTTSTSTSTTTLGPSCTAASGRCAFIEDISIDGDHYVVDYRTVGFEPLELENGGTEADHHVHFFFDSFSVEQSGTNAPAGTQGSWYVWDLPDGKGEYVFDAALLADRGDAEELCVGVADSEHGIDATFSDCVALPS